MRIQKSPKHIAKSLLKSSTKKLPLAVASIFVLASGVLLAQNLTKPEVAMAITPPDSCFAFNSDTGTITDYYDNQANNPANPACPRAVDIPSTIGGVEVKAITGPYGWTGAFQGKSITAVTIPDSVTKIGDYTFSGNQLSSITIPDSVTSIGNSAFASNQLSSINNLKNYTNLGGWVFAENQLTSIVIPDGVTSIGYGTFSNNQLTSITIPNSVTSIGDNTFQYNQLTSITIPNSVTSIGDSTFSNNQLTSITIPDSVTSIDRFAFSNNQLTSVTIPNSVTSIGSSAFSNNQLTSITIPNSVTEIGDSAFDNNRIKTAHLGSGITELDPNTFNFQIDLTNWSGDQYAWGDDFSSDDPTLHQAALGAMFFTRVYTSDKSNPHDLQNAASFDCFEYDESTWECIDTEVIGGHIINPANIEVSYISASGDELQPKHNFAGFANDAYISNYRVDQSPQVPTPAVIFNQTPAEQAAIDEALSAYYHLGDQVTITPPAIDGYITPAAKTFALSDPDTVGSFVYQPVGNNNPGDGTGSGNTPKPLTKVDFSATPGSKSNPTANSVPSSLPPAMANSTFSVDTTKQCSSIDTAKLLPASDFTPPTNTDTGTTTDTTNQVTLGGLDFTLSCTTPGKDAKVSLALASAVSDSSTIQVYKQTSNGKVTNITNQTTVTSQNGKTTITYNLTDGGDLDDDGEVNGQITDPIFVTVPADSELLAETGVSQWLALAVAGVMILVPVGAALTRKLTRQS